MSRVVTFLACISQLSQICTHHFVYSRILKGEKSITYLHFRACTIMFSPFFLAYPSFFHLKKCFYSDFEPSALRFRMGESAVISAAYDV